MQLASMPKGSDIKWHQDKNSWVREAHRVHVPIVTHSDVFFLSRVTQNDPILRIKSDVGEVYEFNNAFPHRVRNDGSTRVHFIFDWMNKPTYDDKINGSLTILSPRTSCDNSKTFKCTPIQDVDDEF